MNNYEQAQAHAAAAAQAHAAAAAQAQAQAQMYYMAPGSMQLTGQPQHTMNPAQVGMPVPAPYATSQAFIYPAGLGGPPAMHQFQTTPMMTQARMPMHPVPMPFGTTGMQPGSSMQVLYLLWGGIVRVLCAIFSLGNGLPCESKRCL